MKIKNKPNINVDVCPKCGAEQIYQTDTRNYGYKRRRKMCRDCGYKFSTVEVEIEEYNELVGKIESIKKLIEKFERRNA